MKIYKTKLFAILSLLLILSTSCDEYLTLEPEDNLVQEEFWQNKEQVESAVAGCYASMNQNNFISRVIQWGELRGEMLVAKNGSSDQSNMLKNFMTSSSGSLKWSYTYNTINKCNTVLAFADQAKELDQTFTDIELNRYKAEVTAIRSLCYFILVRNFREVPLITSATLSDQTDFYVFKNSESEVLNHIVADLIGVLPQLADEFPESAAKDKGFFTQGAAYALLADIYLWQNDFDNCIVACQSIMDMDKYRLVNATEWFESIFFEGNSDEGILELQFDTPFSAAKNFYSELTDADFQAYPEIKELFIDPKDVRGASGTYDRSTAAIFKFTGKDAKTGEFRSTTEYYNNWIFYRYAEILLMQAEAYTLSPSKQNLNLAYDLINQVYSRATGVELECELTVESLKTAILLERQKELAYEGKRWYDLLRFARRNNFEQQELITDIVEIKAGIDNLEEVTSYYADTASYFLPIYQNEVDLNPNLEQNPYYEY